jgi:hypothetical protein
MKRAELEIAIATAAEVIGQSHVLVIGSQAVLGTYDESELPERATSSHEVDIAPLHDDAQESLATRLDAFAGEWSDFDARRGYYIQGVSVRTAYLPRGWESRVVEVRPARSDAVGLCLEVHDLCAAKLARNAEKDREFVGALVDARLVDADTIAERLRDIADERFSEAARTIALSLVASYGRR